ncbi:TPA: PIN domain-containing protein [Candidatus Bathyarchaeota archaeon]|nr:PIN domain-containing protein [Candidatus Bathyarchaeota archaeon]
MTVRIAMDSSVIVKWFKKGEESEREALKLRDETLSSAISLTMSEWVYLEVVRGLVKAGFPEAKIIQAYSTLRDMASLGFIETIPVSDLLEKAKEIEIKLRLYASDAVNLAPALMSSADMLTEDRHLLRRSVRDFMGRRGLRILRLKDLYPAI